MESFCAVRQSFGVLRIRQASVVAACMAALFITPMVVSPMAWGEDAITPKQARKAWRDHHLEYLRVPLKIVIRASTFTARNPSFWLTTASATCFSAAPFSTTR